MKMIAIALSAVLLAGQAHAMDKEPNGTLSHGLTLLERLKYPKGFKHLDYVNPNAPKGGTLRRYSLGTFDTFNPFIIKGSPSGAVGMVFQSLMSSPLDEVSAGYGEIADSVEVADDLSHATFNLRPDARFHDDNTGQRSLGDSNQAVVPKGAHYGNRKDN